MDQYLQNIINPYLSKLQPIKAFSDVMSYDQFAKPLQTYVNEAANQQRNWYDYFTANPYRQQMRGSMAAGGSSRTGFGKNVAQKQLTELYQPLNNQILNTQEQYRSNVITPLYNQRIGQYYQDPTAGLNYGQTPTTPKAKGQEQAAMGFNPYLNIK